MPDRMSDRMSEHMSENMSDRMSEIYIFIYACHIYLGRMTETLTECCVRAGIIRRKLLLYLIILCIFTGGSRKVTNTALKHHPFSEVNHLQMIYFPYCGSIRVGLGWPQGEPSTHQERSQLCHGADGEPTGIGKIVLTSSWATLKTTGESRKHYNSIWSSVPTPPAMVMGQP